jgi:transcriptional regulator with XRE-family HTH domain
VARLAGAAGVPPSTVYNWESGRARIPVGALGVLSRELGTTPQVLGSWLRGARVPTRSALVPRSALQELRARAGLSQSEVAARIGVSRRIVGAWEAVTGARPPLWALRQLATVYQVSVRDVAQAAGVVAPVALDPCRWPDLPLAVVLRTLREWSGLTQADVARQCGRSVAAVRAWEAGRHHPDASSRDALARLYGVSAYAFAGHARRERPWGSQSSRSSSEG